MQTNLLEWIEEYKPNKAVVAHLPGGEAVYAQMVKALSEKFPDLPIHDVEVNREPNRFISTAFKVEYQQAGISKKDLLESDLTLVVNEIGKIVPIRLTVRSQMVKEFSLT